MFELTANYPERSLGGKWVLLHYELRSAARSFSFRDINPNINRLMVILFDRPSDYWVDSYGHALRSQCGRMTFDSLFGMSSLPRSPGPISGGLVSAPPSNPSGQNGHSILGLRTLSHLMMCFHYDSNKLSENGVHIEKSHKERTTGRVLLL